MTIMPLLYAILTPTWDQVGGYSASYGRLPFPRNSTRRIIDCSFTIVPNEDANRYEAFKFDPLLGAVFLPASPADGPESRYLQSGRLYEFAGSIMLHFKHWSMPHTLYVQYHIEESFLDSSYLTKRKVEENRNWFEEGF
jgi:hypothetical protein